jgi:hypothetical protein
MCVNGSVTDARQSITARLLPNGQDAPGYVYLRESWSGRTLEVFALTVSAEILEWENPRSLCKNPDSLRGNPGVGET